LEEKDLICVTTDGNIVFIKLSFKNRSLIRRAEWKFHSETLSAALHVGRNNETRKGKGGSYKKYVTLGKKKDELGTMVDEFAVNSKFTPYLFETQEDEVNWVKHRLWNLFFRLQQIGLLLVPDFDLSVFNKLRNEHGIEDACVNGDLGYFTAMALATEYWSPLHTDNDLFYTLLSCYDPTMELQKSFKHNTLFYFCFPSVGYAVPMKNTDVLLFNSSFPHCATNFRYKTTRIFSLFTSATTIYSGMVGNEEYEEDDECDVEFRYDHATKEVIFNDLEDDDEKPKAKTKRRKKQKK
jgi:hypothetical protein